MQILQHLNRGYFILHPLKKSHKYYKVINILWKEPLPASSCNAHHLILHCFLPTAPPAPDAGGYSKREGWCSKRAKVHCGHLLHAFETRQY